MARAIPGTTARGISFIDETGRAVVSLETWEADQQLGLKFATDEHLLQTALAELGEFLGR